jgi:hypothetical protein
MSSNGRKLKVGDWVEVRSKDEILRTLDRNGHLDGMPFMPEMFAFCGKRFRVYKRAHKTCDTVFPVRGRRVDRTVHLETRCDGSSHGGCQASCLIFWKEPWLKPVSSNNTSKSPAVLLNSHGCDTNGEASVSGCTESEVWAGTKDLSCEDEKYICQATQLPYATTELAWWDIRQYLEDYRSGNVDMTRMISGAAYFLYYALSQSGIGLGRAMRWFYDNFHFLWRGNPFPRKTGAIPEGKPTPMETLNLQPGELVRIKSHADILKTLDTANKNRGLYWDAEEVPYCGGTYRVLKRVTKIIDEKTGRMQEMKTPCVILDSVVCQARYSECRLFCPRSIYPYWREIWLQRAKPNLSDTAQKEQNQNATECNPVSSRP